VEGPASPLVHRFCEDRIHDIAPFGSDEGWDAMADLVGFSAITDRAGAVEIGGTRSS